MFSGFMVNTWIVATIVAVVAGVVGFFVVLRGSSFAAHAIPNSAFAGAAGANLIGASTIGGLLVFAVAGALGIGWLSKRGRHDVATALAIVLMLALGALFLSLSTEYAAEAYSLLFGEVLGISTSELGPTALLGLVTVLAIGALFRPLLLTSVMPEVATAQGVRRFRIELAFLVIIAVSTSMAVPVVGALLMFSLMIGPPAAARSVTPNPSLAIALAVAFALATVWTAIAVSFETNWPIGFFVGALGAVLYLVGRAYAAWHTRRAPRSLGQREHLAAV
jgi:zinc/manganese transport system permease protein